MMLDNSTVSIKFSNKQTHIGIYCKHLDTGVQLRVRDLAEIYFHCVILSSTDCL